ncbi:zinc knuckle CX2CX4HX4C containing protein [Tanacetum coccineum]|uniref:Zinc knuckle CX2CX4HX4C containing protein n=1 Tax=Tanacetum coccineum TaxID=301880 RepID=A0ABQ5F2J8_9ASTR
MLEALSEETQEGAQDLRTLIQRMSKYKMIKVLRLEMVLLWLLYCDSINLNVDESTIPSDPIVQSVDINKSTSYAGVASGSAKDQQMFNVQLSYLVVLIPEIVEYNYLGTTGRNMGLKRIMNEFHKASIFFKFDSRAGLEAVLEGGPWLIRKSPIILKKWSMDTRLLRLIRNLTRISANGFKLQMFYSSF